VLFVSDESGGFDLARPMWDPSLWVTLIAPPKTAATLRRQMADWCALWDVAELHATGLGPEQRHAVAARLAATDLIWTATGTDRELINLAEAEQWRDAQAANLLTAFSRSEGRGSIDPRYAGRGSELHRLALNRRRLPMPAFVQYGIVAPRHYADCVNGALRAFAGESYRDAWANRELLVDDKGPGRQRGPIFMRELLYPILATLPLSLPLAYQAAYHPLSALRRSMKISDFFEGDPTFVTSHQEPLVQAADLIAWIVRRRLTHPDDQATARTYRVLVRRAVEVDGLRVRMMYRSGPVPDDARYRVLLG
jgi:hypothetical protein